MINTEQLLLDCLCLYGLGINSMNKKNDNSYTYRAKAREIEKRIVEEINRLNEEKEKEEKYYNMDKHSAVKQAKKLANRTKIVHYVMIQNCTGEFEIISSREYSINDNRLPLIIVYPD